MNAFSPSAELPFISVVLPTFNEAAYIEDCLRTLLDDPYPRDRLEVFVVDGGSTDGTREIVARLRGEFPFLRLLDNPKRLQGPAFNLAYQAADRRAAWIVRCDAHARYPQGFLTRCIAACQTRGADVVTYADAPIGLGCFQKAVAFAQNSPIGVGQSLYRLGTRSAFVDHGKHGAFLRATLDKGLLYDESFAINEDVELSHRIWQSGGKVWLEHELKVGYYPRHSLRGLIRQYYLYGRGRARTLMKHGMTMKPRQGATIALLAVNLASLVGGFFWAPLWLALAAYLAAIAAGSVAGAVQRRDPCVLLAFVALAAMHHAWPVGFIAERLAGRSRR
ncbi:MAG: glycosyltransferase family 2 protein [Alphaproteobacteria bacterium]|nr:glycosyltransferase family 2 protein [Alphaproteobacteria bacterium]